MSIEEEPGNDTSWLESQHESPKDRQIAELEDAVLFEQDRRKEERFGWIVAVVILLDIMLLGPMANPIAPIAIFILQLIVLLILAKRLGIDYVAVLLDKIIGSVTKNIGKD